MLRQQQPARGGKVSVVSLTSVPEEKILRSQNTSCEKQPRDKHCERQQHQDHSTMAHHCSVLCNTGHFHKNRLGEATFLGFGLIDVSAVLEGSFPPNPNFTKATACFS